MKERKTVEVHYVADQQDWKSWRQPDDKSHRDQLRRIVDEWKQQKNILSELATISPDMNKAIATLLQAHQLIQRATITVQVPAVTPPSPEEETDSDDFEIDFTEIDV